MLRKSVGVVVVFYLLNSAAFAQCWVYGTTEQSCADKVLEQLWAPQYCHGCTSSDPISVPIVDRTWVCTHSNFMTLYNNDPIAWNLKEYTSASYSGSEGYWDIQDYERKCGYWEDCDSLCQVTETFSPHNINISCFTVTGGYLKYYVPVLAGACTYDPYEP